MLENVFGRLSLLSSSTTLPLSRRRLLGAFLLKDALFYGVAFVLPMALGSAALDGLSAATPLDVGLFWLSLFLVFAVGMAVTVALIAVRTQGARRRGPSGWRSVSPSSAAGRWAGSVSFSPFSFRCADPRSPRAGWPSGPSSSRRGRSRCTTRPTVGPRGRRPIASHDSVTCFPSTTRRWSRRPCSTSRAPPAASGSRSSRRAFCSHWWPRSSASSTRSPASRQRRGSSSAASSASRPLRPTTG